MVYSMSRRHFILGATATTAASSIGRAYAAAEQSKGIFSLMRLHPVRFLAGLLFDNFRSVIVEFAADAVVALLRSGHAPPRVALSNADDLQGNANFKHPNYKASVVILGVADYMAHRERELRLLLTDRLQRDRFASVVGYMRDEGIRIKLAKNEYSYPVGIHTDPDDLFTLDYIQITSNQERHYQNLLQISGTSAFTGWNL